MATSSVPSDERTQLIQQLITANCVKFGEFKLKSGQMSPYYVDLREATMYPVFKTIVHIVKNVIENRCLSNQASKPVAVVGVPYGVVPLAGAVAHECKLFYYPVRKEVKDYGNQTGSTAFSNFEFILIEDVMTTGSSIVETIRKMKGKKITDVIVIIDRESGGVEAIRAEDPDIRIHSVLKASEILKMKPNNK